LKKNILRKEVKRETIQDYKDGIATLTKSMTNNKSNRLWWKKMIVVMIKCPRADVCFSSKTNYEKIYC